MTKRLFFIVCMVLVVLCSVSLVHVDRVCAGDDDDTGSGGNPDMFYKYYDFYYTTSLRGNVFEELDYDVPELTFIYEEPVEIFAEEETIEYNEYDEVVAVETHEVLIYTDEDLELLAHLIFAEAGSDWCSDKMQQYTGSVVLNRIKCPLYPNNMRDVIYQKGQYSVVKSGAIDKTPNQRAYDVAKFLLENGSVLPENVVFQSQHIQGDGIYEKVQSMYFCYKNF